MQNDIQFHWKSIALAKSVEFFWQPVCVHKYSKDAAQLTNLKTINRVTMIDALRLTDVILQQNNFYEGPMAYVKEWHALVRHLLTWMGEHKVPQQCKPLYNHRAADLRREIDGDGKKKGFLPEVAGPAYRAVEGTCAVKRYTEADLLLRSKGTVHRRGRG